MNIFTAMVFNNLGIMTLTCFSLYYTNNAWCLLGLLFLSYPKINNKDIK